MFSDEELKLITKVIVSNGVQYDGQASESAVLKIIGRDYPQLRPKMKELKEEIKKVVEEWNKRPVDEFKSKLLELDPERYRIILDEKARKEEKQEKKEELELPVLPALSNATEGHVIMRMAPFPSGALHIGNARMAILNGYYSQRYKGKLFLVFDDTIGSKDKAIDPESYDLIPDALNYLGIKYHEIFYKSDRLEIFYQYAGKLLQMDKLYVCTCDGKQWREKNKITGQACACRSLTVAENTELWEKILAGHFRAGEAVVRMKTGMNQKDPALRDQIALRISDAVHPRVGDKYQVWPLLEYSWGIDDHLLGMTHIIRGIDLVKEGTIEKVIWDWFGWKHPEIILHGRVKTEGFTFSKSKDARNIREGIYQGWDDPRTWSLQAIRRRGFSPKAVWNAILALGIGPNAVKISPINLYHANRELIDDITVRVFGVEEKLPLHISNVPQTQNRLVQVPNHPTNPKLGDHTIPVGTISKNGMMELFIEKTDAERFTRLKYARLMHLFNIKVNDVSENRILATYYGNDHTFIYENKYPFIQWLGKDHLEIPYILETGDTKKLYVEPYVATLAKGTVIQIVRKAFVAIDEPAANLSLIFAHL